MAGTSTYLPLLCLIGFFAATWTGSKVSRLSGVPPLVLEIGAGILFGPQVVQLMDAEYVVCQSRSFSAECAPPADFEARVAEGLPLGPAFGRLVHSGLCDYGDVELASRNVSRNASEDPRNRLIRPPWYKASGWNCTESANCTGNGTDNATDNATDNVMDNATWNGSNWSNRSANVSGWGSSFLGLANSTANRSSVAPEASSYRQCLQRACEADYERRCSESPDLFTMIGHAGIGLLVFENALQFDYFKLKALNVAGWVSALSGAILPMISGFVLVAVYGQPMVPDSLLAGAAMVPTSVVGVGRLMRWTGCEVEGAGKTATTAALLDNLVGLLLFDIFFSLHDEPDSFRSVGSPIIGSILTALSLVAAVLVWPRLLQEMILPKVPKFDWDMKGTLLDDLLFLVMIGILVLYAWIMHLLGNFLWGCFIAGMSFACLKPEESAQQNWVRQTKVLTTWMVRIFYSCTVAFAIPVDVLFNGEAFWKGTILGFFPCILGKVLSFLCLGKDRKLVGALMIGRAEIAFFIASMSATSGMMEPQTYCIVLWALLWANLVGPIAFPVVLHFHRLRHGKGAAFSGSAAGDDHRLDSLAGIDLEDSVRAYPSLGPSEPQPSEQHEQSEGRGRSRLVCCLFVPGGAA